MEEELFPFDPEAEIPRLYVQVAAKLSGRQYVGCNWWVKDNDGIDGQAEWPIKGAPEIRIVHQPMDADQELWVFLHEVAHVALHSEFLQSGDHPPFDLHDLDAIKASNTEEGKQWREREAGALANRWKRYAQAAANEVRGARRTPKDWLKAQLEALLYDLPEDNLMDGFEPFRGHVS